MNKQVTSLVFPSLDAVPSYRRVAELIETEILSGRIKAGDILPTEGDLAGQFGVNRSTVREGIRTLENAGLIKRVGAKRLIVTVPDSGGITWATARALGLHKISFTNLWDVQMELEPFCASLAGQHVSDDAAQALIDNVAALKDNIDDDDMVIASDIEFHRLVAEATGNFALTLSREPISMLLFSATTRLYQTLPQARHRLLHAHAAICDAIVSRDPATARLWMERHIRDFKRAYVISGMDLEAPLEISLEGLRHLLK